MLEKVFIEPANTEWSSFFFFSPKKGGASRSQVDCRRLDNIAVRDWYSLPRMNQCIDFLGQAGMISASGANLRYRQIEIDEHHK